MTWFTCEGCGDSIKKPKLVNHFRSCGSHAFTCIDCLRTFDRSSVQAHTTCVTEHEKYALCATKPGGFAANGFQDAPAGANAGNAGKPKAAESGPVGLEYLSTKPPWRCSVCNVNCTSRETLLGHAQGAKHVRRARAKSAAEGGAAANGQQQQQQQEEKVEEEKKVEKEEEKATASGKDEEAEAGASKKSKKQKKGEKEDAEEAEEAGTSKKSKKQKKGQADKEEDEEQANGTSGAAEEDSDDEAGVSTKISKEVKAALKDEAKVAKLLKVVGKKLKKAGPGKALGGEALAAVAAEALGLEPELLKGKALSRVSKKLKALPSCTVSKQGVVLADE